MRRGQRLPAQGRHRRAAVRRRAGHRGGRGPARACRHPPPDQRVHPPASQARGPGRGGAGYPHPARDAGPAPRRGGPVQPGDSRPPGCHRGDGQNAREPHAGQARAARPDPGGGHRLRAGTGRSRIEGSGPLSRLISCCTSPLSRAASSRRPRAQWAGRGRTQGKGQRGAVDTASACCISRAHKTACFALANATKNASPCVSISWPACLAMASRTGSGAPPAFVHTVPAGPLPAGSNPKRTPHRGKCPRCGHQCRYRVRCISHQGKVSMVPVVIACFPDHRPARHLCCRRNARDSMSARSRWAHRGPAGRRRRAGRPHAPGAG